MIVNQLDKWAPRELEELARRLRAVVKPAPGPMTLLFDKLLWGLCHLESFSHLSVTDAAELMGLKGQPNEEDRVREIASRLRDKISEASSLLNPDPGAYLTKQTYAIHVSKPPAKSWHKISGPSVGLLLADAADWFVGNLIRGVNEVCDRYRYDVLVEDSRDDPNREARSLEHLLSRTEGVLIVPVGHTALSPSFGDLLSTGRCVLVDRYIRDLPKINCVHHDDFSTGRRAAIYLKKKGCKRVLIVDHQSRSANKNIITPVVDRMDGCKYQLGGSEISCHVLAAGSDELGGFRALQRFEQENDEGPLRNTDGVFALTDKVATGCHRYLSTREPHLPVHLISTEGQGFGEYLTPQLVSIHLDVVEMGRKAATVMLAVLGKTKMPKSICRPHFLTSPTLLDENPKSGSRRKIPIEFPDAADHYRSKQTSN